MPGADGEQGDDAHGRFLRTLTAADRILPPGETFSYSNIGYSLAGFAAAEASGMPFAELVRRRVFGPVGMTIDAAARRGDDLAACGGASEECRWHRYGGPTDGP
jgi:CubicO group peptidase (beta-lactamase class C family)